jgi:BASS family bile acid:Na+ symporter
MMMGYYFAKWVGINHRGAFTIAVEMGLQNSALAIFIATSVLNNSDLSLVAVIYSSFTFFSTWLIGWLQKHYLK